MASPSLIASTAQGQIVRRCKGLLRAIDLVRPRFLMAFKLRGAQLSLLHFPGLDRRCPQVYLVDFIASDVPKAWLPLPSPPHRGDAKSRA